MAAPPGAFPLVKPKPVRPDMSPESLVSPLSCRLYVRPFVWSRKFAISLLVPFLAAVVGLP